jgi:hypothetical protein
MTFYHTQEKREKDLTEPIFCDKEDAWLGNAFYFWIEESDAIFWGITKKRKTGEYAIYKASIDDEDFLDTVFQKAHYEFWLNQIEKAAKKIIKKTGIKPSLKEINDYFYENKIWTNFSGILFQDISENPVHYLVDKFQYKKRIQLALFDKEKINNFAHHFSCEV